MTAYERSVLEREWKDQCVPAFERAQSCRRVAKGMLEDLRHEAERPGFRKGGVIEHQLRCNARTSEAEAAWTEALAQARWLACVRGLLGSEAEVRRLDAEDRDASGWVVDGVTFES